MTQHPGEGAQDDGPDGGQASARPGAGQRQDSPAEGERPPAAAGLDAPPPAGEGSALVDASDADGDGSTGPADVPATEAAGGGATGLLPPPGAPGGPREHPLKPATGVLGPPREALPTTQPPPPLTWGPARAAAEAPRWTPPPAPPGGPYPVRFEVAYPERLSRWKTLLRGVLVLPAAVFLWLAGSVLWAALTAGWVAVFFRKRYPEWLLRAGTGSFAYSARWWSYALLLTDRYPAFDAEGYPVMLEYDEPPQGELSRWRVFFYKLVLVFPHLLVLSFLFLAVTVVTVLAWFAILFTGQYPRGLFGFVTGVLRWYYRVAGYFASFNDRFPPFALSAEAGPGARASAIMSGLAGVLLVGGCTGGVVVAAVLADTTEETTVSYAALEQGVATETFATGVLSGRPFRVRLERVTDPGDQLLGLADAPGTRVVVFEWTMQNSTERDRSLLPGIARLKAREGSARGDYGAAFIAVEGAPAPAVIARGTEAKVRVAFVLPQDAEPVELRIEPPWPRSEMSIIYRFR